MEDLKNMETSRVHFFWRALTPGQRKQAVALGHTPPPDQAKPSGRGGKQEPAKTVLPVIAVTAEPVMTAEAETERIEW